MSIPEKLPEDLDCERVLLATICAPGAERSLSECVDALRDDDFVHPAHRIIFQAARNLTSMGMEITPITLRDTIPENLRGRVGDFSGIVELLMSSEEVLYPMALVEILTKHRKRRELIRLGASIQREAQGEKTPEAVACEAAETLAGISVSRRAGGLVSVGECADALLASMDSDAPTGLMTGFPRLDDLTQGFQPGQFIILAARPGIGKTALALNWALSIARSGPVLLFSLEMVTGELMRRMACNVGSISQKAVKARALTEYQRAAFGRAVSQVRSLPILIDDSASITAHEIRSHVLRHSTKTGEAPALVIVDHVGLVGSEGGQRGESEAVRIGKISRILKILAKEVGCPVVALSQLNREVEKADRKPILSDLRDSGCLEQDADIVMFIHRKPKPKMEGEEPDRTAELIIAKHRDGEVSTIPMEFQGGFCRYEEVVRETGTTEPAGRGW